MAISIAPVIVAGCIGANRIAMSCFEPAPDSFGGIHASVVSVHKMGGGIYVADAPDGADLSTMGGDIHLVSAGPFAKLKTMGGDISVERAAGSVDASTMGGKIDIGRAGGAIKASTMAGEVTAHLSGSSSARRDVSLSSMSGGILLTVPKDFGMDVQIKLTYTKNSEGKYRVIQHLGLSERQTTEWDNSGGTPRKYIYVTGRVGNGGNTVKIETINGDISLKQE
ncbi:MAG TPA: hypothetical protein VGG94_02260 [Chthoniobacterales bacterium]